MYRVNLRILDEPLARPAQSYFHMQTALIWMRRWVTLHLTQTQAVWHTDNLFSQTLAFWKLKQMRSLAYDNSFGLRFKFIPFESDYQMRRLRSETGAELCHSENFFLWPVIDFLLPLNKVQISKINFNRPIAISWPNSVWSLVRIVSILTSGQTLDFIKI